MSQIDHITNSNDEDSAPTGWDLYDLRKYAKPAFKKALGMVLTPVPGDGQCVVHAFTRALGLCIPANWFGGEAGILWARLFRRFVGLRCEEGVERAFLLGNDSNLEDVHAVLFSRVFGLRTSIHHYFEFPLQHVNMAEISVYPPQHDGNLMEIHLAFMLDHGHYDVLIPKSTNFYAHKCYISAADLRMFSESADGYSLFEQFLTFWMDLLWSPNPDATSQVFNFKSVAQLMEQFPSTTWPTPEPILLLQTHIGVFAPLGSDLSSVLSAQGRVLDDIDHQNSQTVASERPHDR